LKVLLDECVDARLALSLKALHVRTVADQGWTGISNGKLLTLASTEFEVFVTVDRNLPFQQHLPKYEIVLLLAKSNRIDDLIVLVPNLLAVIPTAPKREITRVGLQSTL
jgi:hypothetical protein